MRTIKLLILLSVIAFTTSVFGQSDTRPEPQVITPAPGVPYQPLIAPPATERTRMGYVLLEPGKSIGRHSTNDNEEFVVVLEGSGVFAVENGPSLKMAPNSVVYCPPNRFHNVTNTGTGPLRYFFIVPKAK
jgi:quercetin dioxygenase-like cupin family protein